MPAKVQNPRKGFNYSIQFVKHPINSFLVQNVQMPEVNVEQVSHGDINRDVKTPGRVTVGNLVIEKLLMTSGSDTWLWDWLMSCQDMVLGGGLIPSQLFETVMVNELAEDGVSTLNTWLCQEVWPTKLNGTKFDRMQSENTIETIEFSVGTIEKL